MSAPYETITEGVVIRVTPTYRPQESDPVAGRWFWAYTVEVENRSPHTVQLLTRHWRITDAHGARQTVDGDGVVGKQPVLRTGDVFRYTSGCPLAAPSGMMGGRYGMVEVETGRAFTVDIPTFALDSPGGLGLAN
ncbi:MAG: Co2+/Mg2+ efflux protein ApaG [Hyphomonadaceae bacterium]|nr:Co2+/Mg2+ efflux protein ApaG [Hyphomonadaceae bacterium]